MENASKKGIGKKIGRAAIIAAMAWLSVTALVADRAVHVADAGSFFNALNGTNVLTVVLFCFLCYIYNKTLKKTGKRTTVLAAFAAAIFAMCELIGYNVVTFNAFGSAPMNAYLAAFDLIVFLGIATMMYCALTALFSWLTREKAQLKPKQHVFLRADKKTFFLLTGLFFACWFIYFLACYPGIVTWDSFQQLGQGYGVALYVNHHPVVHTLIISGIVGFGQMIFGSISAGIAFFTIVQMAMLSSVLAYTVYYMAKRGISFYILLFTVLFFAVYPVFGMYSVSMWKDIWLSACILLYAISLIEIAVNRENFFKSKTRLIALLFILLGMFFFKNSGIYIFFASLPFLIIVARRYWKRIVPVCVAAMAVFFVVTGPVYKAAGVQPGEEAASLSIPLQQIARIVTENGSQLTPVERQTINEILPLADLPLKYQPFIADNIAYTVFNQAQFDTDKMKYIKMWLELDARFPKTAALSLLAGTAGYWYPGVVYWIVQYSPYQSIYDSVARFPQLQFDPMLGKYPEANFVPAVSDNLSNFLNAQVRKIPVLSMLFSIGFFYWIALVCALVLILKKRYSLLLPVILLFGVWLSDVASPVFSEFRYAWPVFLCAPAVIAFTVQDKIKRTRCICKSEPEEAAVPLPRQNRI